MPFAFTAMEQQSNDQVSLLFTNDAAGGTVDRRLSNLSAVAPFSTSWFQQRAARAVASDAAARTSLLRDYKVSIIERTNVPNVAVTTQYTVDAVRDAAGDIDLRVVASAPGGAASATVIIQITAQGAVGHN